MKKLSFVNAKNTLSRSEMKAINGGYSWLYCYSKTIDIHIRELSIIKASITSAEEWKNCRAAVN
jgi:hypothetical protein